MDDHTNESDSPHIQIEPGSPPHPSRRLTSPPCNGSWPSFLSTDSWTTNGNNQLYSSLGTEDDGAHSPHSPGMFTPQSPGTLSPIVEMLGGFSLREPFSGTTQGASYDEKEYRYHGSLLYAGNSLHPSTPSLERTHSLNAQHPFCSTPPHSRDTLYSGEASGQMSPVGGDNSFLFLTDGGYDAIGTSPQIHSITSLLDQWNIRNATPSSPFASPPIETPSPLRYNLSPLSSSPFNSPLNIMPHRSLSPLVISNGTVFSKHTPGYISDHALSADISLEEYMGTESAGPSHSMSTTHDTSPSPGNFLLPITSHVLGYSHATLRSAPPSPSSPSVHRDYGPNELGTRRHSHSSGSDHLFQRMAPPDPEVAKFRKEIQASVGRRNPLFADPSDSQPIAISYINEGPGPRTDSSNSLIIKDIIASAATLEASKKRRKKNALFACHICSQTLTSKDNLISHIDAHQGLKRFACDYCDRRFRTRSVLARHQKSKICPGSRLPQSKRK